MAQRLPQLRTDAAPRVGRDRDDVHEAVDPFDFCGLINWHFHRGTRPLFGPDTPGKRWTKKEFAAACRVSNHTVGNWLNGVTIPSNETGHVASIENAFFGEGPLTGAADSCGPWRIHFRQTHAAAQKARKLRLTNREGWTRCRFLRRGGGVGSCSTCATAAPGDRARENLSCGARCSHD